MRGGLSTPSADCDEIHKAIRDSQLMVTKEEANSVQTSFNYGCCGLSQNNNCVVGRCKKPDHLCGFNARNPSSTLWAILYSLCLFSYM